ncbi:MAG: high potential iron sulfur protein [Roseiarcus sp.]
MSELNNKSSVALSRRTLLIAGVACGAAPLLAATQASATPPKVSQACVGFENAPRGDHRCGNCRLFRAPSSCLDVSGSITENCSCKIWLPKAA